MILSSKHRLALIWIVYKEDTQRIIEKQSRTIKRFVGELLFWAPCFF